MMISTVSPNPDNRPYNLVINVSPTQAYAWLEGNTHNRPLDQAHVDRLARDMKAGRWRLTHQGIAFDTAGLLIDGQHRLWAVIEADVTVPMRVFFNEPPESRHVLDTGQRRNNLDVLRITGQVGQVNTLLLATLRAMFSSDAPRRRPRSPGEEAEQISRHRQALEFALEHFGRANVAGLATAEVRAVVARAYYSADHDRLIHFCRVLRSGMGTTGADHVVLLLRNFLLQCHRSGNGQATRSVRYAKTEWALTAFLDGRDVKRLCCSTYELFPLPEEIDDAATAAHK